MNKVPTIRYRGYEQDWKQTILGEITTSFSGGTPTVGIARYYDGEIPFIRSGEISDDKTTLFISEEGLKHSSARMVEVGDILYALYGATSGEVSVSRIKGAINQAILDIRPSNEYDSRYLMYWLRAKKEHLIDRYLQGGQGNLSAALVKAFEVDYPGKEEQIEIGRLFSTFDTLINFNQTKCNKLTCLKKAMLQKMFPRDGAAVPEIRFKGFTDAWEQRKLGELVHFSKGTGYAKADLREFGTPIILYGRLYTKYETVITDVDTFADAKPVSVYSRGGEVIVPASGETAEDISIASVVGKSGVLLGGDLNIISPPDGIDSAFLAISISNGKPHDDMAKMAQGKSVVHLHNTDLEKIDLLYPDHAEQTQISGYFRQLDNLITLQKCELERLQNMKKSLLDRMFV